MRALDGVPCPSTRESSVAIVGQSGSGKSTLMNVLGCLDIPTYGDYYLDGTDITSLSDRQLARIRNRKSASFSRAATSFQELDALENVTPDLPGVPAWDREGPGHGALEMGMAERAHHRPSGCPADSSSVWPSLAPSPPAPIIMADEPTGALDSKTGKHVLEILRDLYREGPPSCCITTMTTRRHCPPGGAPFRRRHYLRRPRRWIGHESAASFKMAFKSIACKRPAPSSPCWALSSALPRWSSWSPVVQGRNQKTWSTLRRWGNNKISVDAYYFYGGDSGNTVFQDLYDYCLGIQNLVVGVTPPSISTTR